MQLECINVIEFLTLQIQQLIAFKDNLVASQESQGAELAVQVLRRNGHPEAKPLRKKKFHDSSGKVCESPAPSLVAPGIINQCFNGAACC